MSTTAADALPARPFRDVWLISAGHGLTHWYPATFYILLPLIGKELGLSYTQIGFLMSAQHIAGALSNLPGGMIVDAIGKKGYLMAASLFWVGFPYALMSLTHSMWMLVVCVMLVGIGNNLWHPAAIPTLAHQYPLRKGLVLSFHGMGGNVGMINICEMMGKAFGKDNLKRRKMKVPDAWTKLVEEESEKRLDQDDVNRAALADAEANGIVFIDEIDKIAGREGAQGPDVSREGVQRDLLPLIEGTTVSTKHGPVKTDHILFIASGAFHIAKPSDLLPELQGRLPIRVELRALTEEDFVRILTETDNALTRQYSALMGTESVEVSFTDDGIAALAKIAAEVNRSVENIGARRLYTVMERVFEDLSFTAPDRAGEAVTVDAAFVEKHLGELSRSPDLGRYVL